MGAEKGGKGSDKEVRPGYRDMPFVDKVVTPLLGDEQRFVEEEEGPLIAHAVHSKRAFQDELSVRGEVWPLPVDEQRLDLLQPRCPNLWVNPWIKLPGTRCRPATLGASLREAQSICHHPQLKPATLS